MNFSKNNNTAKKMKTANHKLTDEIYGKCR